MFGLGGTELAIVLGLLLLIFGPSQIPKMARSLGQALREFRKARRETDDDSLSHKPAGASPPPDNNPTQLTK